MFNSVAFDVVIGLVFVYLLYSLLGTLIQEIIATNIGLRGIVLKMAIKRMLDDDGSTTNNLSDAFYRHPLIKYLASNALFLKNKPSYIDQETFSKVVIDLLRGSDPQPGASDRVPIQRSFNNGATAWGNVPICPETLTYLKSIWADSQGDVQKFKANLEQWFNEMMDRTTGWYKKYTQIILMIVGLIIAAAFNVDSIKIIRNLQTDPKLREQIIAQATDYTKAHPNLDKEVAETAAQVQAIIGSKNKKDSLKDVLAQKQKEKAFSDSLYTQATTLVGNDIASVKTTLATGWKGGFGPNFSRLSILGWLLTALAISMGAPFWFDLLNKFMQLKSAIEPAATDPKTTAKPDKPKAQ
jgi:hypothetical protein